MRFINNNTFFNFINLLTITKFHNNYFKNKYLTKYKVIFNNTAYVIIVI